MKLIFHPEARLEFREAIAYYESQTPGLGRRLKNEIAASLDKIARHPFAGALVYSDIRRQVTLRFPYAIFYTVESTTIYVIAISHNSREPRYWRDRIN